MYGRLLKVPSSVVSNLLPPSSYPLTPTKKNSRSPSWKIYNVHTDLLSLLTSSYQSLILIGRCIFWHQILQLTSPLALTVLPNLGFSHIPCNIEETWLNYRFATGRGERYVVCIRGSRSANLLIHALEHTFSVVSLGQSAVERHCTALYLYFIISLWCGQWNVYRNLKAFDLWPKMSKNTAMLQYSPALEIDRWTSMYEKDELYVVIWKPFFKSGWSSHQIIRGRRLHVVLE